MKRRNEQMKKFGLFLLGGIAALVLLANFGPLVGLLISLIITYYSLKQFLKADSTFTKVVWALVGLAGLSISIANIPALIGIVAIYILYIVYKKWNEKRHIVVEEKDPFVHFEKEWSELNR